MAQPVKAERLMTFEQAALLDPDESPGELDQGRWVPTTRGTWRHGRITLKIGVALELYARQHPGFSVATADPGTKLRRDPDMLRGPDVGVIRAERMPTGKGAQGWLEGAPDLAVEVMGDDQRPSELLQKALEYLGAGGRMVWLVDSDAEQVVVVTPPDRVRVVGREGTLDAGDVLPGFSCHVAELFD